MKAVIFCVLALTLIGAKQTDWVFVTPVTTLPGQYLDLVATPKGALVLTTDRISDASVPVQLHPSRKLVLFEGDHAPDKGVVIYQRGRFQVVQVDIALDLHDLTETHRDYARELVTGRSVLRKTYPSLVGRYTKPTVGRALVAVSPDIMQGMLEEFTGATQTSLGGQTVVMKARGSLGNGKSMARQWLKERYEALGYEVSNQEYGRGINFVARRRAPNSEGQFLVLSAHLDSVGNAGADDDASGIIASLGVAQMLRETELTRDLVVLGFDEEERGLVGSKNYVSYLEESGQLGTLIGNINIEMLGYDQDGDGAIHIIDCDQNSSADLTRVIEAAIRTAQVDLTKIDACTNRSDHASFWRYGKPAVVVSQNFFGRPADANPCYHKRCDKTDILNFHYMSKTTQALAHAVAGIIAR